MTPGFSTTMAADVFGMAGLAATTKGVMDVASGDVLRGSKIIWYGATSVGCYSSMRGFDPVKITQAAAAFGLTMVGVEGVKNLANAVKHLNVKDILYSGLQVGTSAAGAAIVYSLDQKTLMAAYQALGIALPSIAMARMGIDDLVQGHQGKGMCKIMVGLGGIASAGYYAYNTYAYQDLGSQTLSADQVAFLESHKSEIEQMYQSHKAAGNWTELGKGVSKQAFTHPELPDLIIKIPGDQTVGPLTFGGDWNLQQHHANLEQLKPLAAEFDRVVLPTSHLYPTSQGLLVVEQKLNLNNMPSNPTDADMQATIRQFEAFHSQASLCDLHPYSGHNAGILSQTNPPLVGIIDVDCRYMGIANIDLHITLLAIMMTILDLTCSPEHSKAA